MLYLIIFYGNDAKRIVLIGFNPILEIISKTNLIDFLNTNAYLWYVLSILTFIFYGIIFDLIKLMIKKKNCDNKYLELYLPIGICLGTIIGTVINAIFVNNILICIIVGALFGGLIGFLFANVLNNNKRKN